MRCSEDAKVLSPVCAQDGERVERALGGDPAFLQRDVDITAIEASLSDRRTAPREVDEAESPTRCQECMGVLPDGDPIVVPCSKPDSDLDDEQGQKLHQVVASKQDFEFGERSFIADRPPPLLRRWLQRWLAHRHTVSKRPSVHVASDTRVDATVDGSLTINAAICWCRIGSMAGMSGTPKVLIVEDNFLLLDMLTIQCERAGLAVVAASSGEDALTLLRIHGVDIDWLLTDINLAGMIDGWTVALAFREVRPDRPVIYASTNAYFDRRPLRGSLSVRKPFQIREIVALARMMAAERGLPPRSVSHHVSA